jgi:hypothetical protein
VDFREPHHLPKRRPPGDVFDPSTLPRQRRGVTPQMHGRYPDFDVLAEQDAWDDATREVVLARVEDPPPLAYFGVGQAECLAAFCDVVLAQDREPRIPVLAFIDAKLHAGRRDGYQYADLPDDGELFRLLPGALDEAARARGAESFARADDDAQHAIVGELAEARLAGGLWERYDQARVFSVVMRYVLAAFYAHPWAWNEIGFGGPAYPRGYMRLGIGLAEPWEGGEARHDDPALETREPTRG